MAKKTEPKDEQKTVKEVPEKEPVKAPTVAQENPNSASQPDSPKEPEVKKQVHSSLTLLDKDLYDLEESLKKEVADLQGSSEEKQDKVEIIRLGAANILRQAQAKLVQAGNLSDQWHKEYDLFLHEKGAVDKSKKYLDDLSKTVEQQQKVFARSRELSDVQMNNLIILCSLPEDKFQMLLS